VKPQTPAATIITTLLTNWKIPYTYQPPTNPHTCSYEEIAIGDLRIRICHYWESRVNQEALLNLDVWRVVRGNWSGGVNLTEEFGTPDFPDALAAAINARPATAGQPGTT
jgi:hypothetical protein